MLYVGKCSAGGGSGGSSSGGGSGSGSSGSSSRGLRPMPPKRTNSRRAKFCLVTTLL